MGGGRVEARGSVLLQVLCLQALMGGGGGECRGARQRPSAGALPAGPEGGGGGALGAGEGKCVHAREAHPAPFWSHPCSPFTPATWPERHPRTSRRPCLRRTGSTREEEEEKEGEGRGEGECGGGADAVACICVHQSCRHHAPCAMCHASCAMCHASCAMWHAHLAVDEEQQATRCTSGCQHGDKYRHLMRDLHGGVRVQVLMKGRRHLNTS